MLALLTSMASAQEAVDGTTATLAFVHGDTIVAEGSSFTLALNASSVEEDDEVLFYRNGVEEGKDTSHPYSFTFNNLEAGTDTLKVQRVTNNLQDTLLLEDSVLLTVNQLPAITITQPLDSTEQRVGLSVNWTVEAGDADGQVDSVRFYRNDRLVSTATQEPYEFTLTENNTGTCQLHAVAYDNRGDSTSSDTVTLLVVANTRPLVSLTSPANGASVKIGDPVALTAEATDADGEVDRVLFYQDGELLAGDTLAPFSFLWEDALLGVYDLTAVAFDDSGDSTVSQPVRISIDANRAPDALINSPTAESQIREGSTIIVKALASDDDGEVTNVEFFLNDQQISEDPTAPYEYVWQNIPAGEYIWYCVATDENGASTTSATVTVNVTENRLPRITFTSPKPDTVIKAGSAIDVIVKASDPDGRVEQVTFNENGTVLAQQSEAPFSYRIVNAEAGAYTITVSATDDDGETAEKSIRFTATDNENPTVQITAPENNARFSGRSVTITAEAADADGVVERVAFYRNGIVLGEDVSPPYEFTISNLDTGNFTFAARAFDNDNGASAFDSVRVNISSRTGSVTSVNGPVVNNRVKVYPNPASPGTDVTIEGTDQPYDIKLYNNLGQFMMGWRSQGLTTLPAKSFRRSRIYYLKITVSGHTIIRKLLIQ